MTRQQSRFFNLMEGYTESISLYEQALDSAGTAQSKFNLYLESNRATLDKFRTTLEGLWLTIVDSDSLMGVVKITTSFIEVLDGLVQKLGTVGTLASVLIPLVGIRLAWAFRTAYMEVVKLIAVGTAKEAIAMSGIFQNLALKLIGVKTAAGGAALGMGGLTLATAGLTLGIGLLVAGVMWWANESKKAKQAFADALDNSQKLNDEVSNLEQLIKKQKELTNIEKKSTEQKEELLKIQRELAQLYPELSTGIDEEGNKIAENIEMTKELTEQKRKLLEQELLVIKTTADTKLPQLRQELLGMQEEADRIQKRIANGDTTETKYNRDGMARQVDATQDLNDRLLELVDTQKKHHNEIVKLEAGIKSYNQILEENAERQKWATVEELRNQAIKAKSMQELKNIEKQLKDLGFTSTDIANIISGNIDLVKSKYKELDMQQIINLQTIETLDATQKQAMINMLNSSSQATKQLIEDTKSRIKAIMAEAQALASLTGGKVKTSIISRPYSDEEMLDVSGGIFGLLEKKAHNESVKAQRELVSLEGNLREIERALNNVSSIDTKQISGTKGTSGGGATKEIYKAEADRYARINLELDRNNVLLAKNKTLQDLAGDDLAKKIPLMEEEISLNKQRQQSLNDLNNERRKEMQELQKTLSGQGFSLQGEGDNRIITNLDNVKGKTKEVEEQFKRYVDLQSSLLPQASQEWWNLKNTIGNITTEMDKLIAQQKELARTNWIKEQNDLYDKQQERLKSLESIQEAIVAIIRKRGEEEKKALDENHKAEMDSLEERHKERKEKYTEELDEFKKLIQGKIDALDEQYEQEDYLEQLNKEREEANRLQKEIDVLSLDDSLTARNKTIELRKQLADQNEKIAKMQQKKERDLLKKSLQDQLKNQEQDAKDRDDIADKTYENEKKRLEEDYKINKEFLDKKYSDEKVYAEAKKSIMRGTVETSKGMFEDIYDAFEDFEDKFGKGMGILGDIIKKDFLDQLKLAQKAIEELDYKTSNQRPKYDSDYQPTDKELGSSSGGSSGSSGKGISMSSSDFDKYVNYKQIYDMAKKAGNKAAMDAAGSGASAIRAKYGISSDKYSYDDLKNKSYKDVAFKHGGKVTSTSTTLTDWHGTESKPEWIFNDSQLKSIVRDVTMSAFKVAIPKIPQMSSNQGSSFQIDNLINIEGNVTKETIPSIKQAGNDIAETLKNLNKGGIFRPVKL